MHVDHTGKLLQGVRRRIAVRRLYTRRITLVLAVLP